MKKKPTTKIIRRDADGSEIRQTPGSLGLQVYLRGRFVTFIPTLDIERADALLNRLQGTEP